MDGALYSAQRRCAERTIQEIQLPRRQLRRSLALSLKARPLFLAFLLESYRLCRMGSRIEGGRLCHQRYAEMLVGIIERYGLSQYDRMRLVYQYADQRQDHGGIERPVHLCNDIVYVVASRGDSFETIATDTGIKESKLRKFNEVGKDYMLAEGDIVYLSEKKKHVTEALRMTLHTVQPGESMYSIAQRYGVRMKYLYKWNLFPKDYELAVGDRLVLK